MYKTPPTFVVPEQSRSIVPPSVTLTRFIEYKSGGHPRPRVSNIGGDFGVGKVDTFRKAWQQFNAPRGSDTVYHWTIGILEELSGSLTVLYSSNRIALVYKAQSQWFPHSRLLLSTYR